MTGAVASLGAEDPFVLDVRGAVATCLAAVGRPDDAVEMLTRLLQDRERLVPDDWESIVMTRAELADATGRAGDVALSLEMLGDLQVEIEQRPVDDRRLAWPIRRMIADTLVTAGEWEEAIPLLEALLEDYETVPWDISLERESVISSLAVCLTKAGELDEAEEMLTELLEAQMARRGSDSRGALHTRYLLVDLEFARGSVPSAVLDLIPLLADQERVLGPDSSEAATSRRLAGGFLGIVGGNPDALEYLEFAAELLAANLGDADSLTQQVRAAVAALTGR